MGGDRNHIGLITPILGVHHTLVEVLVLLWRSVPKFHTRHGCRPIAPKKHVAGPEVLICMEGITTTETRGFLFQSRVWPCHPLTSAPVCYNMWRLLQARVPKSLP